MAELLQRAAWLAAQARGGEDVEVYLVDSRRLQAKATVAGVESVSSTRHIGAGVRVVRSGRLGFASCVGVEPASLSQALARARALTPMSSVSQDHVIARPDGHTRPVAKLWADDAGNWTGYDRPGFALTAERAASLQPGIVGSRGAVYQDAVTDTAVATSTGIAADSHTTVAYLAITAVAARDGDTKTGYGVQSARSPAGLDPEWTALDAAQRAVSLLGGAAIPSGRYRAVLAPRVASAFFTLIGKACSAQNLIHRRSFLAGRQRTRIAAGCLTLRDEPAAPGSAMARAHDGEGLWNRTVPIVTDGVLAGCLHTAATALMTGEQPTASAYRSYSTLPAPDTRALAVAPGTSSRDELLAELGDGVLVETVQGVTSGASIVSGDFSVAVEGHLVAGGVPVQPFRSSTMAGNLGSLLTGILAIADDVAWLPSGHQGVSVLAGELSFSGQ
ncbi:MAG TPA: TldD/PmbA family protein [Streptosporangiaceae bacterium]|nr:TldD/PmbA family protein [Streptosporangiaceae bacterium]